MKRAKLLSKIILSLGALSLLTLLASCSKKNSAKLPELNLTLLLSSNYSPILHLNAEGGIAEKKAGVYPILEYTTGLESVLTGKSDGRLNSLQASIIAGGNGSDIVIFAGTMGGGQLIFANKNVAESLRDPKNWRGKTVGVNAGGTAECVTRAALRDNYGIPFDEVSFKYYDNDEAIIAACKHGDADIIVPYYALREVAEASGLVQIGELIDLYPDYACCRQTANGEKIRKDRDLFVRWTKGLIYSWKYFNSDEKGTIKVFDTNGKELWKKELKTAFRNTPLLFNDNIYLLSVSNDLWVLNAKTGKEKWHYKTDASQTLLQGMGRPALADNVLVVPFSSGEVIGFDATTGILLWSQDLVGEKAFDAVASLAQMNASPVIENGVVYLVGHGGKTMAVRLKTGESLWQLNRGGTSTPFVNGNAMFFMDNNNHLVAVNKKSGKLFWETTLQKNIWKGPYLIDEKLILFSDEKSAFVTPTDGKIIYKEHRIKGSLPAVTNDGIFFLGDNGRVYHWEKI